MLFQQRYDGGYAVVIVVEPRYNRNTYDSAMCLGSHLREIVEENVESRPDVGAELISIRRLHVEKEDVGEPYDVVKQRSADGTRRVNTSLYVLSLASFQTLQQKLSLHERLSTRKGYAPTRLVEEDEVACQLLHQLIAGNVISYLAVVVEHLVAQFALHGHRLLLNGLTLRIMAPPAAQRTALEKCCRADAGTVVDGVAFYVENETVQFLTKTKTF